MKNYNNIEEQNGRIKIKGLKIKSFITSTPDKVKIGICRNDGGYTWVG